MELIDDLLEIGTDKRGDDFHQPPIKPKAVERRIEIGWPLHEANGAADPRVFRNAEEDILVPITGAVAQALGVNTDRMRKRARRSPRRGERCAQSRNRGRGTARGNLQPCPTFPEAPRQTMHGSA
jgi:hypothetical protein